MIKHSALTEKPFEEQSPFNSEYRYKVTAISRLATLINSDWKHSMYWNLEDRGQLYRQILTSLHDEKQRALKRLKELEDAENLLESIKENHDK